MKGTLPEEITGASDAKPARNYVKPSPAGRYRTTILGILKMLSDCEDKAKNVII